MRWTKPSSVLAVGLVLALGVAACGSDDDGAPASNGNGNAPAAKGPTKITIASGVQGLAFGPLYLAQQAGYFKDEGLDVKIANLDGAGAVNQAVASGDVFMGWGGGLDMISAASAGQPVRMVGLSLQRTGTPLALSTGFLKKIGIDPKAPLEQRVKALKGATIAAAAPGTGGYVYTYELLREYGLDPKKDVKLVGLGGDPSTQSTALAHGKIDGTVLSPPTDTIIESQGTGVRFINPLTEEMPPKLAALPLNAIATNKDNLEDPGKRATIEAVLRATTRATALIHTQKDQALKLLDQAFPKLAPEAIAAAIEELGPAYPDNPAPTQAAFDAGVVVLKDYDAAANIPGPRDGLKLTDVANTELANNAYTAAQKSGGS